MTANWILGDNPHRLPKPPDWFLKLLWDQDSGLVVLPSCRQRKYLLARRRDQSLTTHKVFRNTKTAAKLRVSLSDGDLLETHNLVLVDSITSVVGNVSHGSWMRSAPAILSDLRKRDMWSAGGADKYLQKESDCRAAVEDQKRSTLLDNLDHRAGDAWRSYQARTGQRTRVGNVGISRTSRAKIVQVGTL